MTATSRLTMATFARCIGQGFALEARGTTLGLTLREVRALDHGMRAGGAFALLWQGPAEPRLAQGTEPIAHAVIGAHPIFLGPVARTEAGIDYFSVFT